MVAMSTTNKPPLLYGFYTDAGKKIVRAALACKLPTKDREFLGVVLGEAGHCAGFERDAGNVEAGLWCDFDTADWASELGWTKQYTGYIRDQLVELGVLSWHPCSPGKGRLRVNPNLAEWIPLQAEANAKKYARRGAGRPRKDASERNETDLISVTKRISKNQPRLTGSGANHVKGESGDAHALAIGKKSESLRSVGENYSESLEKIIRFIPPAGVSRADESVAEVPPSALATEEPKKDVEEEITEETVTNVTGASLAALPSTQVSSHVIEHMVTVLPNTSTSETKSSTVTQATFGEMPPTAEPVKKQAKRQSTKKPALSPEEAERLAQEKATFAARLEELTTIWLAHPRTVKPEQMGDSERRTFYAGMNKLAHSSATSAELPKLLNTMAGWAKGAFIPDPYVLEGKLGKLRLEASKGATNGTTQPIVAASPVDPAGSYSRFETQLPRRNSVNA